MQLIWNVNNIQVFLCGAAVEPDPCFVGFVHHSDARVYQFKAIPQPEGYYILYNLPGQTTKGSVTGATWNLALEVAQGILAVVGPKK